MKSTFAVLAVGVGVGCSVFLLSRAASPQGPAVRYMTPPQGPDEPAVAQTFEALVQAYGSRDWDGVMAVIAADAQLESAAPNAAGCDGPRESSADPGSGSAGA
jgi:hypothetical protein